MLPSIARSRLSLLLALSGWLSFPAGGLAQNVEPDRRSPGRVLAERYCTGCHLMPEPDTLTKTAWAHHIQPEMAKWLGIERVDYEGMADGRILEAAAVFPGSPSLPEKEWFAIWDYYRDAAPSAPPAPVAKPALQSGLPGFRAHLLNPIPGAPMISMLRIDAGTRQLQVADAFAGGLWTLDKAGAVIHKERFTSPPIAVATGQRRSYLMVIGRFFPSDSPEGAVMALPERPEQGAPRVLLENLRRPVDFVARDFDQDGREDFAVCQFGYRLGSFSWFANRGDGRYEENVLLDRPGALAVKALDLTRDGLPDLVVMTGQAREGVYLFENQGRGEFRPVTLLEKPPTWGFAGFDLVDVNRDGAVDLLTANGDNGDFGLPLKAYHGVRLYLNDGTNHFRESFFYPLHGAYRALGRDFDGDGDVDIVAVAYYADYSAAAPETFVYLENRGGLNFVPRTCPEATMGRWMTMDVGDLDGDGDDDLALGSFIKGPTTMPVPAALRERWRTNGAAVLLLENRRR